MAIWYMKLLQEQKGMFSVSVEYPKEKYVESENKNQKNKGWFYDSETKKFYRWDNFPRSK
jgi:hypothetical protein